MPQSAAMLMLGKLSEHKSDNSDGDVIDAEVVEAKTPPRGNSRNDMDDEIPF